MINLNPFIANHNKVDQPKKTSQQAITKQAISLKSLQQDTISFSGRFAPDKYLLPENTVAPEYNKSVERIFMSLDFMKQDSPSDYKQCQELTSKYLDKITSKISRGLIDKETSLTCLKGVETDLNKVRKGEEDIGYYKFGIEIHSGILDKVAKEPEIIQDKTKIDLSGLQIKNTASKQKFQETINDAAQLVNELQETRPDLSKKDLEIYATSTDKILQTIAKKLNEGYKNDDYFNKQLLAVTDVLIKISDNKPDAFKASSFEHIAGSVVENINRKFD